MSAHVAGLVRAATTTALKLKGTRTYSSSSASASLSITKTTALKLKGTTSYSSSSSSCFYSTLVITLLLLLLPSGSRAAEMAVAVSAADSLLRFKAAMSNNKVLLNWNASVPPCNGGHSNWVGVSCSKGNVRGLVLEKMNLMGPIDMDSLLPLVNHLRTISFKNNNFNGPMPQIKKLGPLKTLFLSNNHFSGNIPDNAFSGMGSLKKLYLSNNDFTGRIPSSVATLPKLMELRLDGNRFRGHIPDFTRARSRKLRIFNVSRNQLVGPIPVALADKPASSFEGNEDLCGDPLYKSCEPANNFVKFVIGMLLGVVMIGALVLLAIVIVRRQKRHGIIAESEEPPAAMKLAGQGRSAATYQNPNQVQHTSRAPERLGSMNGKRDRGGGGEGGRLSFIRNDREKFDLQDLLRASAEVLGSGNFGSSYKAVVGNGQSLVVKRYKYLNCGGKEDFHNSMRRLGRLDHPNLLPLVAYYYRREEKLLICDFVPNGGLASHLHRNRNDEEAGLDWGTRLKIVKGVAKGLAYLYAEFPNHTSPHGHIKSTNVLVDKSFNPILTDYALVPMMNEEHASQLMVAYKSPEYAKNGRINKKTDVWCLGILILEILTGKFPENYLMPGHNTNADLASWVNSMVKEKRTGEVFDPEMEGGNNCKGQMIKLLKVGLSCCQEDPEMRLELREVVDKLEDFKEMDDNTGHSPYAAAVTAKEAHRFTEM